MSALRSLRLEVARRSPRAGRRQRAGRATLQGRPAGAQRRRQVQPAADPGGPGSTRRRHGSAIARHHDGGPTRPGARRRVARNPAIVPCVRHRGRRGDGRAAPRHAVHDRGSRVDPALHRDPRAVRSARWSRLRCSCRHRRRRTGLPLVGCSRRSALRRAADPGGARRDRAGPIRRALAGRAHQQPGRGSLGAAGVHGARVRRWHRGRLTRSRVPGRLRGSVPRTGSVHAPSIGIRRYVGASTSPIASGDGDRHRALTIRPWPRAIDFNDAPTRCVRSPPRRSVV